jgi:hypothetical protein
LVQSLAAALSASYDESFAVCEELLRSTIIDRTEPSSSQLSSFDTTSTSPLATGTGDTQWLSEQTMMRSLLVAAESPFIDVQLPAMRALLRLSCQPRTAARLFLAPLSQCLPTGYVNLTPTVSPSTSTGQGSHQALTVTEVASALQRGEESACWLPLTVLYRLLSDHASDSVGRAEPELIRCALTLLVNLASAREHHAALLMLNPMLDATLPWLTLAAARETKRQVPVMNFIYLASSRFCLPIIS